MMAIKRLARGIESKRSLTIMLPLLFSLLFSTASAPAATTLYTQTDELACGDTRVKVFTTCTIGDIEDPQECTKQYFLFTDQRTGTELKVKASGRPSSDPIEPGSKTKILDGLAWRWGCVRGKAGQYIMIDYGTGGNCETCEWVDIFDLNGRKVLTDRSDKDRRTDREIRRFRKKWKALGLPDRWPGDSLVRITTKRTDR